MSAKPFVVNNNAAAAVTFSPTVALKDGQQYLDGTVPLSAPRGTVVKHSMADLSKNASTDRHYVQFTKTVFDANGVPFTASIAVSVVLPRTQVTSADVLDLRAFAKNFIGDAAIWPAFTQGDY